MSDLSPGWISVPLGEVCEVIRGITFPASSKQDTYTDGNVACLRTASIQRDVDWSTVYFVPKKFVRRQEQFVRLGDILMSMANSYNLVGKVAQATRLPYRTAFGAFLSAVRPASSIEPSYLFHTLRTERVQAELRAGSSQTTNIANISIGKLAAINIAVAPPAEQKRIADKLEAVLGRVDTCRARLDQIPALLKRFRQSVLATATSGQLTEDWRAKTATSDDKPFASDAIDSPFECLPQSWGILRAANIVEKGADIVYGIVQPGPKLAAGVPYVRGMDIEGGRIRTEQLLKTSEAIAARYSRSALQGGDVLLGIIRATKVARVPDELKGANITQGTARFRPSSRITSAFLAAVLESPVIQRWLHDRYRGIDMPGLNLADVRQTPIPVPPLPEQHEIVRRVETLFAFADRIEARLAQARAQVERLTPAVLAKAFRGELVPQDPNDEPASALLARLRSQTNGAVKPKRRKARG